MDNKTFMEELNVVRRKALLEAEKQVAEHFGLTIVELRKKISEARKEEYERDMARAIELKDAGVSIEDVAKELKVSQGVVLNYLSDN